MRFISTLVIVGALTAMSVPATAQQQIDTDKKNWKHDLSGIKFPREIVGMQRRSIIDFTGDESNIGIRYLTDEDDVEISVYVYPYAGGDLPVWFDRAHSSVINRTELFGELEGGSPIAFTPPGADIPSGLWANWSASNDYQSTLLALFPVRGGLAKIRMSARELDVDAANQLVRLFMSQINWKYEEMLPAVAVLDCPDALTFAEDPKPVEQDEDARMQSGILSALFSSVVKDKIEDSKDDPEVERVTYCRDASSEGNLGVYRGNGNDDRYLLALADSGQSIAVYRDGLAALLSSDDEETSAEYVVNFQRPLETIHFPPMDGLPAPDIAYRHIQQSKPISISDTSDGSNSISIMTN